MRETARYRPVKRSEMAAENVIGDENRQLVDGDVMTDATPSAQVASHDAHVAAPDATIKASSRAGIDRTRVSPPPGHDHPKRRARAHDERVLQFPASDRPEIPTLPNIDVNARRTADWKRRTKTNQTSLKRLVVTV